jgi:hypothetical protein
LVESSRRYGQVTILSGAHGFPEMTSKLKTDRGLFLADLDTWGGQAPRIEVIDFTRLSIPQAAVALNREGRVICAWCYSTLNSDVLQMLTNPFKPIRRR